MTLTRIDGRGNAKKELAPDELEILLKISNLVTSNLDLDEILYSVHALLPGLIPHNKSCIFFYHEKTGKITVHSNVGLSERMLKFLTGHIGDNFLFKKQLETGKGWRSTDIYPAEEIKNSPYYQTALRVEGILYGIGAPIMLDGNFIGSIHVTRPESKPDFSLKELKMLELVAGQIGIAVKNVLAFEKGLKEKEHIITVMEQKVKQAERLAALGRAAAIIAHEVKNPLASIRISLYSIEKKAAWKMNFEEDLNIVREAVERVSRTMEDLLHFSGDIRLQLREVDLNELLKSVASDFRLRYKNSMIIETSLHKQVPPLRADGGKLKEVFSNLISNAIAASASGGTIRITSIPAFDRVLVTVEDWGGGIPPEIRQKIFEPFFTTKQSGTGLGLAIAKKNIEAHRGTIEVESEPGWGTKFTVTLPFNNTDRTR